MTWTWLSGPRDMCTCIHEPYLEYTWQTNLTKFRAKCVARAGKNCSFGRSQSISHILRIAYIQVQMYNYGEALDALVL
jgi:hypothetical protein